MSLSMATTTAKLGVEHPVVHEEVELLQLYGDWCLRLVGLRYRRLMYLTQGWLGLQFRLLGDNKAVVDETLRVMSIQHDSFLAANASTRPFWKRIVAKSVFQHEATAQLVSALRESGWRVTEDIRELVRSRGRCVNQSKIAEDQFCKGRKQESGQANKLMAEKSVWRTLIDAKVSDGLFRFRDVGWKQMTVPAGDAGIVSRSLFHVKVRDSPPLIKDVSSAALKHKWFSTDPEGYNILHADL